MVFRYTRFECGDLSMRSQDGTVRIFRIKKRAFRNKKREFKMAENRGEIKRFFELKVV